MPVMKESILKFASVSAFGTAAYVVLIASFLFYVPRSIGENKPDTVFIPIAMLLLFVLSAAVTAALVLGRPILWYLDGRKTQAVSLFLATLGILFLITVVAFSVMIAFS